MDRLVRDGDTETLPATVSDAIAAWREAERRLERLDPDGTDWIIVMEHIEVLRTRHRMLAARAAASEHDADRMI